MLLPDGTPFQQKQRHSLTSKQWKCLLGNTQPHLKGYFQLFLPSFTTLIVTTPISASDKKGKRQQLETRSSPEVTANGHNHLLLHPATTFSLYPLHLLPSFQLTWSWEFSASFLLLLSFARPSCTCSFPVLSAPKATKCTSHYTTLLPPWAVWFLQLWDWNRAAGRRRESSVPSKARGMSTFNTVIMVRQIKGRRAKHSTVQNTALYRWRDSPSEHCVAHRRWLWCALKHRAVYGKDREEKQRAPELTVEAWQSTGNKWMLLRGTFIQSDGHF